MVDATLSRFTHVALAASFQVFLIKPRVARSAFMYARIGINPATTAGNAPGKDYLVAKPHTLCSFFLYALHHRPAGTVSGVSSWQYEV
jgi:hypothetical protein